MRKKVNCIVLVVLLISTMFVPMSASAADNVAKEMPPDEVLIVGYHDIWRHSDGKTWQASGRPDTYQECIAKIAFQPKGEIESITAVYFPEKTALVGDLKYVQWNVSEMTFKTQNGYKESISGVNLYNTSSKMLEVPCKYYLHTKNVNANGLTYYGFDIKQYDWQGQLVSGYRYYLPIKVTITYKGEEQPEENPLPPGGENPSGSAITTDEAIEETPLPVPIAAEPSTCKKDIQFTASGWSHRICVPTKYGCKEVTCVHSANYIATLSVTGNLKAVHPSQGKNTTTFKSGYGFTVSASGEISVARTSEPEYASYRHYCNVNHYNDTNHGATITPPTAGEVRTAVAGSNNPKGWTVTNEDLKKLYKVSNKTQGREIALERSSLNGLKSTFKTAQNPVSNYFYDKTKKEQSRVIYTAIDLSGTRKKPVKHSILIYLCGGGVVSNGTDYGSFCHYKQLDFTIDGNMYEDSRVVTNSGKWTSN